MFQFIASFAIDQAQAAAAELYLESMGYLARKEVREVPISLSYTEAQSYLNKFKAFDKDGDGHIRYTCVWLYLRKSLSYVHCHLLFCHFFVTECPLFVTPTFAVCLVWWICGRC